MPYSNRRRACFEPALFRDAIVRAVQLHGPVYETDLQDLLRCSDRKLGARIMAPPIDGVRWMFGIIDFRASVADMVRAGRINKIEGRATGGGIKTTYFIPEETL